MHVHEILFKAYESARNGRARTWNHFRPLASDRAFVFRVPASIRGRGPHDDTRAKTITPRFAVGYGPLPSSACLARRAHYTPEPVPKATCGPSDRIETVQGQTTLAERFAPGPAKAFNCNLELVGQFEGEGASALGLDALDDCAYFSISNNPATQHPGVAVIDVSSSSQPAAITYLTTDGMLGAFESVAVLQWCKLLIASRMATTNF